MTVRPIADQWEGRPTFAVVDLDALATNVEVLRRHTAATAKFCAVVKANAYGMGAVPVARVALRHGADMLAVATVDEGAELRLAGITAPILVLGPIGADERPWAIDLDLQLVLNDPDFVESFARTVRQREKGKRVKLHLKVDTGMRRFGMMPERVLAAAKNVSQFPELELAGLMTHFASADVEGNTETDAQMRIFQACVEELEAAGIQVPVKHVANSAGTLLYPQYHLDMVRPGLVLYGVRPAPHIPLPGEPGEMRQVLTVHSMVARVIDLAPGDRVSYGGTWQATQQTRGALIPVGYADGYMRAFSSRGWMTVNDERADVIGRVCMDQTIVHLPDYLPVENRNHVVIVGNGTADTPNAPTLEELALLADTIPHEVSTGLAHRLTRIYIRHGEVAGIMDLGGYHEL